MKKKILIVGNGGRESAFAKNLAEDSILFAVMSHENPTIKKFVEKTKGNYLLGDINDGMLIKNFALKNAIDYAFINCDEPLALGVVDILLKYGIKTIGPTKEGSRIEWDKIYSIELMNTLLPEYTPIYRVVASMDEIEKMITEFENKNIALVVKPQNLTGGKGVKVMGEHLKNYNEAKKYAIELLSKNKKTKVLLVEKLDGIEFTIMGITDGKHTVFSPASYDYPYRYIGDKGPGTGGMGCFTNKTNHLPFIKRSDYETCTHIMETVLSYMDSKNIYFNGVLNGGFFLTRKGIRFMEFNARFGDPEAINTLSVLDSSFSKILENIQKKELTKSDVKFIEKSSVVKYLVAPNYPYQGDPIVFSIPTDKLEKEGVGVLFSSAKYNDKIKKYITVSSSRVVALSCVSETIAQASEKINKCIDTYLPKELDYRRDIGTQKEIERLTSVTKGF